MPKKEMSKNNQKIPTLFLGTDINSASLLDIEKVFQKLVEEGNRKLVLKISSRGGMTDDAVSLFDQLRTSKMEIKTIVYGHASSMAVMIMMVGSRRLISRNSRLFLHEMGRSFDKPVRLATSELYKHYLSSKDVQDRYIKSIHEAIGGTLSINKLERMMVKETYLTPEEAVKYNFAHEVI